MPLKTLVKVGGITNLSDARYCAGMGVEMLGFGTIQGQENYIDPLKFQEIRGWITGPRIVAEIYGIRTHDELTSILENYKPDILEFGVAELELLSPLPLPFILNVGNSATITNLNLQPAYIRSTSIIKTQAALLIDVKSKTEVAPLLSNQSVKGIVLNGGAELKPGLKDFEVMNDVLEMLETDD